MHWKSGNQFYPKRLNIYIINLIKNGENINIHSGKFHPVRYCTVPFLLFIEYISSREQEIFSEIKRKRTHTVLYRLKTSGVDTIPLIQTLNIPNSQLFM